MPSGTEKLFFPRARCIRSLPVGHVGYTCKDRIETSASGQQRDNGEFAKVVRDKGERTFVTAEDENDKDDS